MNLTYRSGRGRISFVFVGILLTIALTGEAGYGFSSAQELVVPRNEQIISPITNQILDRMEKDGLVKVWVHFTDKGVFTKDQLVSARQATGRQITARAAKRRLKMGIEGATFYDLPVPAEYLEGLETAGASLRRVSRWLNAASIQINRSGLAAIGDLPYVREITPVLAYRSSPVEITAEPLQRPTAPTQVDALNYGASLAQLEQINVVAAHNAGYTGAGVLVCMIDTGYRKDHDAFASAFAEGRVLAEYDFVFDDGDTQNEPEDTPSQHYHGTYTWSTLGGAADGFVYGPAYGADFLLAKTEDMRSETPIEEDNMVAALEWAETYGTDVVSTSLGYIDWYTQADLDGNTAVTTVAADIAAGLGIVFVTSAGNDGPVSPSLTAPTDADSVLSVGWVSLTGEISPSSSRGPTADGRIKPEVCALGSNARCATASSTSGYTYVSGTSLACPLVGGAAALVLEAHPDWTPMMVREALMQTADNAAAPNNDYGWGVIDVMAAINYSFTCDCTNIGDVNLDNQVDPVDVTLLVNKVYKNTGELFGLPECGGSFTVPAADVNCDGGLNPVDVVFMVNYVYKNIDLRCDPCACASYPDDCP